MDSLVNIKGMQVYTGKRDKTGKQFTIPMLKPALDILHKYSGKLPIISNVKYNAYLKVVAQAAGIDKPRTTHWVSHSKFFYLLNISELSILKNVTANDLETSYILFLSQLCNIQRTL